MDNCLIKTQERKRKYKYIKAAVNKDMHILQNKCKYLNIYDWL